MTTKKYTLLISLLFSTIFVSEGMANTPGDNDDTDAPRTPVHLRTPPPVHRATDIGVLQQPSPLSPAYQGLPAPVGTVPFGSPLTLVASPRWESPTAVTGPIGSPSPVATMPVAARVLFSD